MKLSDMSKEQLVAAFQAMKDLLDGEFYSASDIQYQTGLDMDRCESIATQFRIIRDLNLDLAKV